MPARTPTRARRPAPTPAAPWTFLTNHAHVLLLIARDRAIRVRDIAAQVGITERAVQRIIGDLEAAGYLERQRDGRRNHYAVRATLPLRHQIEGHCSIGALIKTVNGS